ncbi:MAG: hypothetical protein KDA60_00520, partial [Planctomycetales bacterium]|nr:hypothetical protein [Planctomycetales bacterium]
MQRSLLTCLRDINATGRIWKWITATLAMPFVSHDRQDIRSVLPIQRPNLFLAFLTVVLCSTAMTADDAVPNFTDDIEPVLTTYCAGCHTEGEDNGDLSMDTFADLMKGGESGAAIVPGKAKESLLIKSLRGEGDLRMPPEGEEAPTEDEIALLTNWIAGGAPGPGEAHNGLRRTFSMPALPAANQAKPITALAYSPAGDQLAIARFQQIEVRDAAGMSLIWTSDPLPGKVNSLRYSSNGAFLVAASGVTGLYGQATVWRARDGKLCAVAEGHDDVLYTAVLHPDNQLLATAGYDSRVHLWHVGTLSAAPEQPEQCQLARTLTGHNGPVFEIAFDPTGKVLTSASGDATVKIWRVGDGERLDTRSEPLKEQYTTAIHPAGHLFVGAGADNRIRVWELVSRESSRINPIVYARYAHEAAIQSVRFSEDGRYLVSTGKDQMIKLWDTSTFQQIHLWPDQPTTVQAIAISAAAQRVAAGRFDGSLELYDLPAIPSSSPANFLTTTTPVANDSVSSEVAKFMEAEPNDLPIQALTVEVPAQIQGVIGTPVDGQADADIYRFKAGQGEHWIVEIDAARQNSPLDSFIEILDRDGNRVPRVALQAVRDSYFTFRGKDSNQTDDFRLHNWEEMQLNQLLYCNGEVVKFYHYPRGPDSGFNVYPNFGARHGFFDTTPTTHALQEPCYVVRPFPPDSEITPNGLPTFTLYYENDDESQRQLGTDSKLTFVAPQDGEYLIRVADVRGQGGDSYHYQLHIRQPQPGFAIRAVHGKDPQVMPGRGHKFGVEIDRIDGFDEPIAIEISGLPEGFRATPMTIESGHFRAWGTLWAPTRE